MMNVKLALCGILLSQSVGNLKRNSSQELVFARCFRSTDLQPIWSSSVNKLELPCFNTLFALCAGKYFLKRGCPLKNSSTRFLFHVNVSSGELSQETPMCLSESSQLKVGPDRQSMARNVPDIRTHSAPPNPIPEQQTLRRKCSKKDRGQHNIVESK